MTRHFQNRVEGFFREIVADGPLGKTNFVERIKVQESSTPWRNVLLKQVKN